MIKVKKKSIALFVGALMLLAVLSSAGVVAAADPQQHQGPFVPQEKKVEDKKVDFKKPEEKKKEDRDLKAREDRDRKIREDRDRDRHKHPCIIKIWVKGHWVWDKHHHHKIFIRPHWEFINICRAHR